MNITIVGAGNIGTQFAVHCAEKSHQVTMFSSKPEKIQKKLTIVNEQGDITHEGIISKATNNPSEAFSNANLIFITMPAFCMGNISQKILPFVVPGLKIGIIPGTGGGECAFKNCIEKGAVIFGLQRVPSVARLVEYGKCVKATGYRKELHIASLPGDNVNECASIIENLFGPKCIPVPNYLNVTLTPSNPILHTVRLRILFKDYKKGMCYQYVPLFYEEWNDESSELLLKCDDEVQKICQTLKPFDLSFVKSLRIHYESSTAHAMTRKIVSIPGFKGLESPVIKVENGYIPDFNSRYFTADFPYGLSILVQIANFAGVSVPHLQDTLNWYYNLTGKEEEFSYPNYGIRNLEEFIKFYSI